MYVSIFANMVLKNDVNILSKYESFIIFDLGN